MMIKLFRANLIIGHIKRKKKYNAIKIKNLKFNFLSTPNDFLRKVFYKMQQYDKK